MINKLLFKTILFSFIFINLYATEKIFIVEREDSSLAVVNNGVVTNHINGMHNMNHGVVKFYEDDAYAISRDGYIVKFDPKTEKILNEYKTSKSAIGFVISKKFIAVANYDSKSVNILDRDLKPLQVFYTDSKNVGIKLYKNYLIFSQMDNDKITVLKNENSLDKLPNFKIYKEFEDVGTMPFDAMIKDNNYISGFFKGDFFGVVDLDSMKYSKIKIYLKDRKPILKVPHFGFWSISNKYIFIPAVGDNKVLVYTPKFKFVKNIETFGLPVFTSLSPDKKFLAVTFSGKNFPIVQIIDTKTLQVVKKFKFDGKVLHLRWSTEKPILYISVNDSSKMVIINREDWSIKDEIFNIKKPSGIFIYKEKNRG